MIDRGSDKHGRRLDEALAHETEGAVRATRSTPAEEWREPEPTGKANPTSGSASAASRPG
jgi:hypothetical protein